MPDSRSNRSGGSKGTAGMKRKAFQILTSLPGVLFPLLPKGACPLCLGAYGGLLSAVGLGFLATDRVLAPLIIAALGMAVGGVALTTLGHRKLGPLTTSLVGAGAVATGRFLWNVPLVLYGGLTLLFLASLWNLWL